MGQQWLTPEESSPSGMRLRRLFIPDDPEYLALVSGALSELLNVNNYEQFGAATPEEVVQIFQTMYTEYLDIGEGG